MNFDTYKHFDPYSLRDLFNNNSDLVLEYYHYENEAIQCQELLDCSINTKKELINISKDIFKLISIIRSFTDINKNDLLKIITPSIDKNIYYDSYNRWKEKLTLILNK